MIRTFVTHKIRKQEELTGKLWEFSSCQGEHAGRTYKVATPCCWESHPDFCSYRGEGIYTTRFEAGGNIRLEFKGVSHTAEVKLDGEVIAEHYNAYTSFSVVKKDLKAGLHVLEVKADNRFSEASALHIPNDYMSYGGISRPVVMEEISDVYIEYIHVTPYRAGDCWKAGIEILVKNIGTVDHTVSVQTEIAEKCYIWEDIVIKSGSYTRCNTELFFDNVLPWSMEEPRLYTACAIVMENGKAADDLIERFGFREISLNKNKIYLNGKAIRIKGVNRHEDHPQFGCALPFHAIAADLEIVKHLGANSVRTSHYPNDELFLDLCDEQGILVWEENHARGLELHHMKNPHFEHQAETVIREMIPLHYNHPCIWIWGILNECASDTEYGRECYKKQFDIINQLDTSRPRSFASCKFKTDICFDLPDIISYNIYPQWYHDTPVETYLDELYQWVQQETEGAGKPFLISEIGAGGIYGYRNPHKAKWTEEYQAEALEKQVRACLEHPECSGIYIWQFCDIRISEEWFYSRPRSMNNKGIVDEYRRPKLSYEAVKRIFGMYGNYM